MSPPPVNICSDISAILEALEGPNIEVEDLFWLAELPTGLNLLRYLVAQGTREPSCVYLEREENQILQKALRLGLVNEADFTPWTANDSKSEGTPSFVSPSSLRLNLTLQEEEHALLNQESTLLEFRKAAMAQSIEQNLKTRNAFALSQQGSEGRLKFLSNELMTLLIESDTCLTSASRSATQLIHEQACLDLEVKCSPTLNNILDMVQSIHKEVIRLISSDYPAPKYPSRESVTQLQNEVKYLTMNVSRLEKYITGDESGWGSGDKYFTYLKDMWNLEQSISLKEQVRKTCKIIQILEDNLIPLIALSNASLNACNQLTEETLILCQTLLDEIEAVEAMNSEIGSISTLSTLSDSIVDQSTLSNFLISSGDDTELLLHVHQGREAPKEIVKPVINNMSNSLINLKNQNLEIRAQFPADLLSQDALLLPLALNKEVLIAQRHVKTLSRLVNEIPLEVKIDTEHYMRLKTSVKNA